MSPHPPPEPRLARLRSAALPLTPNTPRPHQAGVAALIVALGLALRVGVLLTYERDVDGDEAVVGQMALRIQQDGERFLFWPGRPYNGGAAINAYLGALAFRLFGASSIALKAPALLWSLLTLLAGYALAWRFLGAKPALWALALLAFGPPVFCRWGVKCYLGTIATLLNLAIAYALFRSLFGGPLLGGPSSPPSSPPWEGGRSKPPSPAVSFRCDGPTGGPPDARGTPNGGRLLLWPVATGVLIGLAYYVSPFVVPMVVACAVFGVLVCRDFLTRVGFWAGVLGLALGSVPAALALAQGSAAELAPRPGLAELGGALAQAAVRTVYFFGNPNRYFGAPSLSPIALISGIGALAALVAAVGLGLAGMRCAAVRARRGDVSDTAPLVGIFGILFLAAHAGAFVLSPQDVQYWLPAYPFAAVLIAHALSRMPRARLGAAWCAALVAANVWGSVAMTGADRRGFDRYVYGGVQFRSLVEFLKARRIRHVYASSAIAHILTFQSRREIVAVSYDAVFSDDARLVHEAGRYAYVFCTGSDFDTTLHRHLVRQRIGHQARRIGACTVRYAFAVDVRPEAVTWRADALGAFPDRPDLWRSALRLSPWNPAVQYRLLRDEAPARKESP